MLLPNPHLLPLQLPGLYAGPPRWMQSIPKVFKQAVLRRTQTEVGEELTFKPCLVARRRSVSAGRQRPAPATGAGRIDQLAKPRTQLWAKCEMESHKGRVGSLAF